MEKLIVELIREIRGSDNIEDIISILYDYAYRFEELRDRDQN